ncbi:MAG: zinc-ribbon domain-containing protein [Methanobacterium sp. ERen5]|nr:MAG: zinc-ribbon domain-containing protein [Methanobacterium sp. ERen5]
MTYCEKCGTENADSATFCKKCGESTKTVESKKTSRTIELVLGILGGIFGLLGGVFALMFSAFAPSVASLGVSAVIASIVGLIGSAYVLQNPKWGGIILIISAVWLLISISLFGVLGAVLLGLAGLLAVLRK